MADKKLFRFEGTSDPNNNFVDWLAAVVESHWESRRDFCKEAGIDPGTFSKQLASAEDLSYVLLMRMYGPLLKADLLGLKDRPKDPMRWWEFLWFAGIAPVGFDQSTPGEVSRASAWSVGPLTPEQNAFIEEIEVAMAERFAAQNSKANTPGLKHRAK